MNPVTTQLTSFFYPVLLGLVSFFLLQFYLQVKEINKKTTEILVDLATRGVRLDQVEAKIEKLEKEIQELKQYVFEHTINKYNI